MRREAIRNLDQGIVPMPSPRYPVMTPDRRMERLLGAEAWSRLPIAIRHRFSRQPGPQDAIIYQGDVTFCRIGPLGRLIGWVGRLIGAPIPMGNDAAIPATVVITDDPIQRWQYWTRIYGTKDGFPHIIKSQLRFSGETGFEEILPFGLTISFIVQADAQSISFHSSRYFIECFKTKIPLPQWLAPGRLIVRHIDRGGGFFNLVLSFYHPLFGELVHQDMIFQDTDAVQANQEEA